MERKSQKALWLGAFSAMLKKPVVTEVRTPTNTWSGLGFSKSMPAETIKELRRANHVSYKPTMSTTYEVREVTTSSSTCIVILKLKRVHLIRTDSSAYFRFQHIWFSTRIALMLANELQKVLI